MGRIEKRLSTQRLELEFFFKLKSCTERNNKYKYIFFILKKK